MGIRSQNNPIAAYLDVFSSSGTDASAAAGPGRCTPGGLTATGGIINDYTSGSNAYRAHTFTTSGAFEVTGVGNYGAQYRIPCSRWWWRRRRIKR